MKMDTYTWYVIVVVIGSAISLLGTGIMAFQNRKNDKENKDNFDRLIKLGQEIDRSTTELQILNENIACAQASLNGLAEQNLNLSTSINQTQTELSQISLESKSLLETVSGMSYGANSFLRFTLDCFNDTIVQLSAILDGRFPLVNPRITIADEIWKIPGTPFDIKEENLTTHFANVTRIKDGANKVELDFDRVRRGDLIYFGSSTIKKLDNKVHLKIMVQAENFTTIQEIISYDVYDRVIYSRIRKHNEPDGNNEELFYENEKGFPVTEKRLPIRDESQY